MDHRVIKCYSSEWKIALFPLPFKFLLPLFLNWFFILIIQMVSDRNFSYLWKKKVLLIRFEWFKKFWATPFSHSGLSLCKLIKGWIKDLPAWLNIPLWSVWVSFCSPLSNTLCFFYWDNDFSESIEYHNSRIFSAFNEGDYLPNEIVCTAIYSFTAACGKEEGAVGWGIMWFFYRLFALKACIKRNLGF